MDTVPIRTISERSFSPFRVDGYTKTLEVVITVMSNLERRLMKFVSLGSPIEAHQQVFGILGDPNRAHGTQPRNASSSERSYSSWFRFSATVLERSELGEKNRSSLTPFALRNRESRRTFTSLSICLPSRTAACATPLDTEPGRKDESIEKSQPTVCLSSLQD